MKMYKYTFDNGDVISSRLEKEEMLKRMNRLDTLRVLVEQCDCEEGISITKKALRAYNKVEDFTGIIRLTPLEKDWLSYMLESDFNTPEEIETIKFYCKMKEED